MADEISSQVLLKVNNGGVGTDSSNGQPTLVKVTQSGIGGAQIPQLLSHTTDAALAIPTSIGIPCLLAVRNCDPTNFVRLSTGTGGSFAGAKCTKIRPLLTIFIEPEVTIYGLADTADCLIQITAVHT